MTAGQIQYLKLLTPGQWETLGRLCDGKDPGSDVSIVVHPFDLPAGYVMVHAGGITYGISPEGIASS